MLPLSLRSAREVQPEKSRVSNTLQLVHLQQVPYGVGIVGDNWPVILVHDQLAVRPLGDNFSQYQHAQTDIDLIIPVLPRDVNVHVLCHQPVDQGTDAYHHPALQ
jgi:hypothetical protein